MQFFDAIIVGAGPAGGQCARELCYEGKKVLLIERAKDFGQSNYSSGGAPNEIMDDYQLPDEVIGATWNKLAISSSQRKKIWYHEEPQGVVIEFSRLRGFLAQEALDNGGEVRLHTSYLSHEKLDDYLEVTLKNHEASEIYQCRTKVLVDATGTERKVLDGSSSHAQKLVGTGIEYLIEVEPAIYENYANTLSFYLGTKWMPQGYAWIFPMSENQLKVGIIRYFADQKHAQYEPAYHYYLNNLLDSSLPGKKVVLDKHGKTISYSLGRQDQVDKGPVIAIGDAISTINPLAYEGIRHAMYSGRAAAAAVDNYLEGHSSSFGNYRNQMDQYFGFRWKACEYIMKQVYKHGDDRRYDALLRAFEHLPMPDIMDLAFSYRFGKMAKFLAYYFFSRAFTK